MPGEKTDAILDSIEKKIDKVADELATVKKDLTALSSVKDIDKKVEALESEIKGVPKTGATIEKKLDKMASDIVEVKDSKEIEVLFKKVDDVLVGLSDLNNEMSSSTMTAEMGKKIEEMAGSFDGKVISKKIDDLQQYVAGLSDLEETVQEVSGSLTETKEIVGIIVRQLDDIERKYNQAIEKIEDALETLTSLPAPAKAAEKATKKAAKKTVKEKAEEEKEAPPKKVSKSSIDEIMKGLLKEVTPQTEAREMARALEDARDRLTAMISAHTPVLFQFGKKARELKSYPPTATLNENDIASLNTEIRGWATKIKEMAK
ncbi:MAG: hypothetical protein ACXADF_04675 [Candidatus Thorarchaeota archaeon]|jgi:chromosome segregation ATPase